MTRKSGDRIWATPAAGELGVELGINPAERSRPWGAGQTIRVLGSESASDGDGLVVVWVEHRRVPQLAFKVEVADRGVVGFHVRPLVLRVDRYDNAELHGVDDRSVPPTAQHLTARRIRSLPVGEICDAAVAAARRHVAVVPVGTNWPAVLSGAWRPGARGRPNEFYAQVAADYVSVVGSGCMNPVAELGRQTNLSRKTISNLLHEARRRDLLTRPPVGRAGGELTPKARALLEGEQQR